MYKMIKYIGVINEISVEKGQIQQHAIQCNLGFIGLLCLKYILLDKMQTGKTLVSSSLQCYSVLSDILVKSELCIPLERGSNVLPTGEGFICLCPPSKLKIAVLFYSIYKKTISFSAIVF